MSTIEFGPLDGPHGYLSNFAPHPIEIDDKRWPTSEHYFQGQKFAGTEHEEAIRLAASPMVAAHMGRSRKRPLRKDWEQVKDDVMRRAVRAKFEQHPALRASLLATGDATLIEHTPRDAYWGDGGDGSGKNMLGRILMEVRRSLSDQGIDPRVLVLRRVVKGQGKRWALFENGTVVFVTTPGEVAAEARRILRAAGLAHVGTASADFSVITLSDGLGWAVTCHHPDVLSLVLAGEAGERATDLSIGLLGRSRRSEDATALKIVHAEGEIAPAP